ncbi:LysR family transcriptional regulator [Noviherbaspirillum denitrificans]|uniref:HTH lysR-type domain-containing protein n=1 Tax=Noviherbaspirillum denitrificans TaxID=1968433 RepID=A0A254T9L4_9BURK|nr:LysR family transcriptional regulator [Noviherbaspirillum denitrificans]OWW19341.1 hypothetical protein AYR66_07320 [Noviherbaspirillum denitrificans]
MDKFRAAEYFVVAAREGSLSAAARQLEVSVAAVSKLIAHLEKELGTRLFERKARGLVLTSQGIDYLAACEQALGNLSEAEQTLKLHASSLDGTLTIGLPSQIAQHWILPALPIFHRRYPGLALNLRTINRVAEAAGQAIDLFVLMGWHDEPNLVRQLLGANRMMVCASPAYWADHVVPSRPEELAAHTCHLFRNPMGTVLDLWEFERGDERVSVTLSGWLSSDHRDTILAAALAGHGVVRLSELTTQPFLRSGQLVPVLTDWKVIGTPPVQLFYPFSHRNTPRVKAFIDFLVDLFPGEKQQPQQPQWWGQRRTRASGGR